MCSNSSLSPSITLLLSPLDPGRRQEKKALDLKCKPGPLLTAHPGNSGQLVSQPLALCLLAGRCWGMAFNLIAAICLCFQVKAWRHRVFLSASLSQMMDHSLSDRGKMLAIIWVVAKLRRGHRKRYHLCKLPTDCWQVVESSVPWRDHQCPRRVGYCLCAGAVGVRVGRAPSYEVSPAHRCLKVISVMAFQNILIPHYPSAFKLVYSPGFLISLSNPPSCSSQNLRGLLDAPYFDNY